MKRFIITLFLSWCTIDAFSQDQYVALPITYNASEVLIDSLMNQCANNKGYNRALVYSPSAKLSSICCILIIDSKDSVRYWAFRNEAIIKQGTLPDGTIFNYKDYKKAGVVNKEQSPAKLTPPLMCNEERTEWIMYKSCDIEFYFEYGDVSYYAEDPERVRYRKEWLDIIRSELKDIIF